MVNMTKKKVVVAESAKVRMMFSTHGCVFVGFGRRQCGTSSCADLEALRVKNHLFLEDRVFEFCRAPL